MFGFCPIEERRTTARFAFKKLQSGAEPRLQITISGCHKINELGHSGVASARGIIGGHDQVSNTIDHRKLRRGEELGFVSVRANVIGSRRRIGMNPARKAGKGRGHGYLAEHFQYLSTIGRLISHPTPIISRAKMESMRFIHAAALAAGGMLLLAPIGTRAQTEKPKLTDAEQSIVTRLKGLRKTPDEQRAAATKAIALDIRKLPADPNKIGLANGLANLSTEGDFGKDTLQEVANTLADAVREQPTLAGDSYLELANLARYEHVTVALDSEPMQAAMAKLEADDRDRQQADFTLADLTGKKWTLQELHGKVVLVNFWATWCPPCRKEMPDLDALYRQYKDQGLVILALSDETADKVVPFLTAHPVSYPILLDAGRKVNDEFHVNGIPKSFVYDRDGKLVAQSIDMRTRAQFLQMLGEAGLAK